MRLLDIIGVINAPRRQEWGDTNRVDGDYRIFMRSFAKVAIPQGALTLSGGRQENGCAPIPSKVASFHRALAVYRRPEAKRLRESKPGRRRRDANRRQADIRQDDI
jgi:hypothetical protein